MPEMGALRTHSQWTDIFYIHTDIFSYLILVAILTWSVCLMGHSLFSLPFISLANAQVRHWATSPDILLFHLISFLLILDYDNLGVRIEGELPDGAPHMITCE
jgi:hypothetical protein